MDSKSCVSFCEMILCNIGKLVLLEWIYTKMMMRNKGNAYNFNIVDNYAINGP